MQKEILENMEFSKDLKIISKRNDKNNNSMNVDIYDQ